MYRLTFCLLVFWGLALSWSCLAQTTTWEENSTNNKHNSTISIERDAHTGDDVIRVNPRPDMQSEQETQIWYGPILVEPKVRRRNEK